MKQKIASSVIYAVTTIALAGFLFGLYAMEAVFHLRLVHAAAAGAVLFAAASVCSWFALRLASICGLVAAIVVWPLFLFPPTMFPRGDLVWFAQYRTDTLSAICAVIACTIWSVYVTCSHRRSCRRHLVNKVPLK